MEKVSENLSNRVGHVPVDGKRSELRENIEAVIVAVLLAVFIRTFVVQAFKIPSGSMIPTLQVGDHILVNKFVYGVRLPFLGIPLVKGRKPAHGDIVVFKFPEDPRKDFIKRVIGVGGDIVEIRDKRVYVNGRLLPDKHAIHTDTRIIPGRDDFGPVRVPMGKLFVMGDNRDSSYDSRFWKFVDLKAVLGKAFMIYWSWNDRPDSVLDHVRWDRICHVLR